MKRTIVRIRRGQTLNKKAFTLIELLAVIVILAIIALIATPIILNIIKDAKENSNKRSIDNYAKAVENAIAKYQLSGKKIEVDNLVAIKEKNGKEFENINLKVDYDGNVVCEIIEINESGTIFLTQCKVNGEAVEYAYGVEGKSHLSEKNVQVVSTPTTGIVPSINENGDIELGSEFKIKVSDDSGWLTFFVLSNDENYVNLIAQQNITSEGKFTTEIQDNDEWYKEVGDGRYGPQTAYTFLSKATKNWTNIPKIKNFYYEDEAKNYGKENVGYKNIITEYSEGKYITTINPFSLDFGTPAIYKNMNARLPFYKEFHDIPRDTTCRFPLWLVDYTYTHPSLWRCHSESTGKTSSVSSNYGYWLMTSYYNYNYAYAVSHKDELEAKLTNSSEYGIRPVITILKSDLLRVM